MSVWWNSTLLTVGYVCCLTQGPESEIFKKDKDE